MEYLGLVKHVVLIADPLAKLGGGVPGISRNNPVNEGAINAAGVLEPVGEAFPKVPEVDVLADALLEVLAVLEYQLAREDDESLGHVSLEILVPVVQELGELAGIREGWLVVQLAIGIKGNSGLGGVGDDEAHLGLLGELEVFLEFAVGVESPADHVDHVHAVDTLTLVKALEIKMIEAILLVKHVHHSFLDGLYDHDGSVEIGLLVRFPDDPLDERAEEITFSELDDLLSVGLGLRCRFPV